MADNNNNADDDERSDLQRLGPTMLKTAWQFQAVLAAPIFILMGMLAFDNVWRSYETLYDFITDLFTALLAGGVIFVVLVQRQLREAAGARWTFRFEAVKLLCATGLWVWFLMDAIFGPSSHFSWYNGSRERRIAAAGVSVIVVILFFIPTVVFSYLIVEIRVEPARRRDEAAEEGERAPLLPS